MQASKVYFKDGYWMVDYIDSNYELLPAVGIFVKEEDAIESAKAWNDTETLEAVGKSSW
jgi:hypothetical protein